MGNKTRNPQGGIFYPLCTEAVRLAIDSLASCLLMVNTNCGHITYSLPHNFSYGGRI